MHRVIYGHPPGYIPAALPGQTPLTVRNLAWNPPLAALERAPSNSIDFAAFVADRLQGAIYTKTDRADRRKAQVLGAEKAAKSRQVFRNRERSGR